MNWFENTKLSAKKTIPSLKTLQQFCDTEECYEYAAAIANRYPHLKTDSGFYLRPDGTAGDHGWVKAPDGTIIDTTHGQFDSKVPILIAKPGTPEHARYYSYDQHHAPDCLHEKLGIPYECQVCGKSGVKKKGNER